MSRLFNRDFVLTIGDLRIAARPEGEVDKARPTLRASFKADLSRARDPNKSEVVLFNLAGDSRRKLQEESVLSVTIEAGYTDSLTTIFSGDLEFAGSTRQGADWVTELEAGDGAQQYRRARMNQKFSPGTLLKDLLEKAVDELGVGVGNALEKIRGGGFRANIDEFTKGVSVSGKVSDVLDKYFTTAGFEWSIQNGQLQVLRPDEATADPIILVDKASGLIGSPELGEKGRIKVRTLLQGGLFPGRQIQVRSEDIDSAFTVERVVHIGDTWGTEWYSDVDAKPRGTA